MCRIKQELQTAVDIALSMAEMHADRANLAFLTRQDEHAVKCAQECSKWLDRADWLKEGVEQCKRSSKPRG